MTTRAQVRQALLEGRIPDLTIPPPKRDFRGDLAKAGHNREAVSAARKARYRAQKGEGET